MKTIRSMGVMGMMLLGFAAHAQNPIAVRSTNGVATNLTALGTTTADVVTVNAITISNSIVLGAATNVPTFSWVQTNWIDGQIYFNHTGRMIEARCFLSQLANATKTAWEAVMINGTVTSAGVATVANGTGGYGFTNMCSVMISNGTSFAFTNQSSVGGVAGTVPSFSNGYTVY